MFLYAIEVDPGQVQLLRCPQVPIKLKASHGHPPRFPGLKGFSLELHSESMANRFGFGRARPARRRPSRLADGGRPAYKGRATPLDGCARPSCREGGIECDVPRP